MVPLYVSIGLLVQLTLLAYPLRANPTGAPLAACSTLVPSHHASPTPCGEPCPYKISVISGNLPRPFSYRCGVQLELQLQTSGPPFKGLVVQSRISSATFDGSSSFVGSFVSGGSDWKIWNCGSPSATHSSGSLKTSVNLTWKAPGVGSGKNVTFWYSIVADYATYYVQLKGPDLAPYLQSCTSGQETSSLESLPLNDQVANTLVCHSDVRNNLLNVSCEYSRPPSNTLCSIDLQPFYQCKLPFTRSLTGLPSGAHTLTVLTTDARGANTTTTTRFNITGPRLSCTVLTVSTMLNVRCTSDATGIAAKCSIDQDTPKPCTIPYSKDISSLAAGSHQITISITTTTGTMLTTTESFIAQAVLQLNCVAGVHDSILSMNCNSSNPVKSATCLIDGKAAHACTLPYTRSVSALSVGIHTIAISASGVNGVNGSFSTNFSVQAHLGLSCYTAANSSILVLTCTPDSPLVLTMCAIDGRVVSTPCALPYVRDITGLAIGAHTITVTATGVNGATAVVTEQFTRPEFLICMETFNSSILTIHCNSSKALKNISCTLDNKETHACVLPYVRSVSSLSTGLHTMNISATTVTGVVVSYTVPFTLQARLTLNCSRTLQKSMLSVSCSSSNPLVDILCSLDSGVQRMCHVPFVFNASSLRPGEHTVLITARGSNGATATSSLTFQINAGDSMICNSDVTDSVLNVACNAGVQANKIVCTIDGKGPHQCMLPYIRRVTSLSLGRHRLSLYLIGDNGRNTTVDVDFFIQARLNLQCSYVINEGAKLIVSCIPSEPLARVTCGINNETSQSCSLPYTRDVSILPQGIHTLTVSATGTNNVSSISVLSFNNAATISLNCVTASDAPIDSILVVNCISSVPLSSATCAVDGEMPLPCVFPYVKNVTSFPSGVHVVAISAIGTNRASSVALVHFSVVDLIASCSRAVDGPNLYITCDANYPIQFTSCAIDQGQQKQCDLPITLPMESLSKGIHLLNITVNAVNKSANVSVRFMINGDGSVVL